MITETKGSGTKDKSWVPILEVEPTDKFSCSYDGYFAQRMQINTRQVGKFLSLAELDGGDGKLILKENSTPKTWARPEGNSDGSLTGKGSLRWGEKPTRLDDFDDKPFVLKSIDAGWEVSVNSRELFDQINFGKQLTAKQQAEKFAGAFNSNLRGALELAIIKDKLTLAKDPYLKNRLILSVPISAVEVTSLTFVGLSQANYLLSIPVGMRVFLNLVNNYWNKEVSDMYFRAGKESYERGLGLPYQSKAGLTFGRRTVKSIVEVFGFPVEFDRCLLGLGYLEIQKLRKNPLVRLAN